MSVNLIVESCTERSSVITLDSRCLSLLQYEPYSLASVRYLVTFVELNIDT